MLKIPFRLIVFYFTASLLFSCIDPFDPDVSDNNRQSLLVVDGFITDDSTTQEILLSRSIPLSINTGFFPERGAIVTLKDNRDNCYQLREEREGVYVTDPTLFQAEVGISYQLDIQLSSGEEYISDFQEMMLVEPLDSTWFLLEEESFLIGDFVRNILALNIYEKVDPSKKTNYAQYSYEGTYETDSPLQGATLCWLFKPAEVPSDLSDTLKCYRNETAELPLNIFESGQVENAGSDLNSLKIFTVPSTRRFEFGYSMLIKKSAVTQDYFNFMSEVKAQTKYGGGLFDPPPSEIVGNIINKNDENDRALGFFSTKVSTTKRIFISGVQVIEDTVGLNCEFDLDAIPPEPPPFTSCCDCRLYPNSTDKKPDFWPF